RRQRHPRRYLQALAEPERQRRAVERGELIKRRPRNAGTSHCTASRRRRGLGRETCTDSSAHVLCSCRWRLPGTHRSSVVKGRPYKFGAITQGHTNKGASRRLCHSTHSHSIVAGGLPEMS